MTEVVVSWAVVERLLLEGGASPKVAWELQNALREVALGRDLLAANDGVWTTVRVGSRMGCAKRARHVKHGDDPRLARGFLIAVGRLLHERRDYESRAVRAKMQRQVCTDAGAQRESGY